MAASNGKGTLRERDAEGMGCNAHVPSPWQSTSASSHTSLAPCTEFAMVLVRFGRGSRALRFTMSRIGVGLDLPKLLKKGQPKCSTSN